MKASTNVPSDNPSRNHLTRRRALQGAAACGALALPVAAVAAEHLGHHFDDPLGDDPAFAAIVAEYEASGAALDHYEGPGGESERKVQERWYEASKALYRARPKSLRDIAKQIRVINDEMGEAAGWLPDNTSEHVLAAIAEQLEALAGRAAA